MLKRIILFIPVIFLSACLEESSEKLDKKAFTRIYDNSEFYSSFYAIDMKPTADGGYLILGGKTEVLKEGGESQNVNTPLGVYLLKTDEFGKIVNELQLDEAYTYPIGKLNQIGDSFYFFCMDAGTNAVLVNVDQLASFSEQTALSTSLPLPLASSTTLDGNSLLLLSYDNGTQESVMTMVSTDGAVSNETRFYTGAESPIDNLVIRHANREGTQFPFSVGQTSANTYFFNGFIDYTFSLVFTSLGSDEDVDGIVNGQQENAGFSNVLPITGQTFAISTYNFGFNFLKPNATLNMTGTTSVTDIQSAAFSFPELESNARVKAIRAVVDGKNVILFGSNTKSGQIGLYMYDEATGEFSSSKYLGYSNPFEIAALVQTTEGDFAVAGTTYIAGRLP
ncbi:MAG TPA: hypothetical protein PKX08_12170 [Cyclobacteriaceae bacterium]|nr:hypothetical protein [Cyclobacteriaceae bacterium]